MLEKLILSIGMVSLVMILFLFPFGWIGSLTIFAIFVTSIFSLLTESEE